MCFWLPPVSKKNPVPKIFVRPSKYWCIFCVCFQVLLKEKGLHLVCYDAVGLFFILVFLSTTIQCATLIYELLCNIARHITK